MVKFCTDTQVCECRLVVGLRALIRRFLLAGIAGAVTSIAVSPSALATTSLDRYVRTHSFVPPPTKAGSRMDNKGTVSSKTYVNCVPTCITWDGRSTTTMSADDAEVEEGVGGDDDVWEGMEEVSEDEEVEDKRKQKRRNVKS